MSDTPSYCPTKALDYLEEIIAKGRKVREWYVSAWATTILKKVFPDDQWILIPERANEFSGKRPDLVVLKHNMPYLLYEVKAPKGDRLEKAIYLTLNNLHIWVDAYEITLYIIIQRGCNIAFFEYHDNSEDLDAHNVPHIWHCVFLTQRVRDGNTYTRPIDTLPKGVLPLYHNHKKLKKTDDSIRNKAKNYKKKCIFDLICGKIKKRLTCFFTTY